MSDIIEKNSEYAEKIKSILGLRAEPVAIRLIREGETAPVQWETQDQMSHCQAFFRARAGEKLNIPMSNQSCHVGASALGMVETPEKVASGEFHANVGIHDSVDAAGKMINARKVIPFKTVGELMCPLGEADFEPDVVVVADIPERIYWIAALITAVSGGRAVFTSSPFQSICEDVTVIPITSGLPNISLGCFGCRKRTGMANDELVCGVPYSLIPGYVSRLEKYKAGALSKAKR
ncbi:MAG: DUF169 domain-containing protein [Candidatus Methanoplasma sp.]|jgi:uncharacterized protein (DUF169 family)|nr:DUF169 domain-containing protein [Candidatus Methanoplasma sp.]